jgi:hypothetical protein
MNALDAAMADLSDEMNRARMRKLIHRFIEHSRTMIAARVNVAEHRRNLRDARTALLILERPRAVTHLHA